MKETARNILKRNFDTEKLNEKWVSDKHIFGQERTSGAIYQV